jgi:hypothetical protein
MPADREDRRLRLTILSPNAEGMRLRLTEESFSDAVGWFAQGHVDLSPSQIQELRSVLGVVPRAVPTPQRSEQRPSRRVHSACEGRAETVSLAAYRAG